MPNRQAAAADGPDSGCRRQAADLLAPALQNHAGAEERGQSHPTDQLYAGNRIHALDLWPSSLLLSPGPERSLTV